MRVKNELVSLEHAKDVQENTKDDPAEKNAQFRKDLLLASENTKDNHMTADENAHMHNEFKTSHGVPSAGEIGPHRAMEQKDQEQMMHAISMRAGASSHEIIAEHHSGCLVHFSAILCAQRTVSEKKLSN